MIQNFPQRTFRDPIINILCRRRVIFFKWCACIEIHLKKLSQGRSFTISISSLALAVVEKEWLQWLWLGSSPIVTSYGHSFLIDLDINCWLLIPLGMFICTQSYGYKLKFHSSLIYSLFLRYVLLFFYFYLHCTLCCTVLFLRTVLFLSLRILLLFLLYFIIHTYLLFYCITHTFFDYNLTTHMYSICWLW